MGGSNKKFINCPGNSNVPAGLIITTSKSSSKNEDQWHELKMLEEVNFSLAENMASWGCSAGESYNLHLWD